MNNIAAKIKQLEISLFQADIRRSEGKLESLLADDFKEYMSSGGIYFKEDALSRLPDEQPLQVNAGDFEVKLLTDECALITYRSIFSHGTNPPNYSLRSSIWQMINGHWQIVFHQGTLCPAFELTEDSNATIQS